MNKKKMAVLIVKTSSLGDIVHSFHVLHYLHERFPSAVIHWAVAREFAPMIASHPLVSRAIPLDLNIKKPFLLIRSLYRLRSHSYDLLFDLQGNCKSGLVTLFARAKCKVGFGFRSAREWPNCFCTHVRFDVSKKMNIRLFNLQLIQRFFEDTKSIEIKSVVFQISPVEQDVLKKILNASELQNKLRIMVCPGARWPNKQLPLETWRAFLMRLSQTLDASFLLIWGSKSEKTFCEQLCADLEERCLLVDRLPVTVWQTLMGQVDLVIAVDSSAIHLCGITTTPSFSLFGPTSPSVFKPCGPQHGFVQGRCPYGKTFEKQCPILRSCPTGACMRDLNVEHIFEEFQKYARSISKAPK